MKFLATGRLPKEHVPASPLITLLEAMGARGLHQINGLEVDHRLGYNGHRVFQWGAQALRWLKPENTFSRPPSESYQNKRFTQSLYLEDLQECCHNFPNSLLEQYPRLCRPQMAKKTLRP